MSIPRQILPSSSSSHRSSVDLHLLRSRFAPDDASNELSSDLLANLGMGSNSDDVEKGVLLVGRQVGCVPVNGGEGKPVRTFCCKGDKRKGQGGRVEGDEGGIRRERDAPLSEDQQTLMPQDGQLATLALEPVLLVVRKPDKVEHERVDNLVRQRVLLVEQDADEERVGAGVVHPC